MILVPVKDLVDAKQRLSSILSPEERFALARTMCEDVLQALGDAPADDLTILALARDPD